MSDNGMEQYDHWYRSWNHWNTPASVSDPADQRTEIENRRRNTFDLCLSKSVTYFEGTLVNAKELHIIVIKEQVHSRKGAFVQS